MKPSIHRISFLCLPVVVALLFSCSHQVFPVTDGNKAMQPLITINGFADGGNIEKNNLTGTATINADYGMAISISGSAKNPGGVKDFHISIAKAGTVLFVTSVNSLPDGAGKVPDQLTILGTNGSGGIGNTPMKFVMDDLTTVTVSATNYAGNTQSFELRYVPVAASQRGKNITETITLTKNQELNNFSATVPVLQANGTLVALNGGPADVYLLKPTVAGAPFNCSDPNATKRLPAFGNFFPQDYIDLFGSEHPALPLKLTACALGPSANADRITLQMTYRLN